MMQPAGYLAFSLHGENGSHHTVANQGTISAVPAPFFLHPAEEESDHRRPGLPLGLRPPPLLPSQGLYSLAVFFLPPSTSPLSKIMAVVTETTLLASHLPSSIALLFFFFGSSSQPNFLESVYTSCFHFLTCRSLSSPFQPGFHSASST